MEFLFPSFPHLHSCHTHCDMQSSLCKIIYFHCIKSCIMYIDMVILKLLNKSNLLYISNAIVFSHLHCCSTWCNTLRMFTSKKKNLGSVNEWIFPCHASTCTIYVSQLQHLDLKVQNSNFLKHHTHFELVKRRRPNQLWRNCTVHCSSRMTVLCFLSLARTTFLHKYFPILFPCLNKY